MPFIKNSSSLPAFICDSAIHYLERNLQLAQNLEDMEAYRDTKIKLAHLLASSGMYKEAVDILDSIPEAALTEELKIQLYHAYDHVYGELAFYSRSEWLKKTYYKIARQYKTQLFQRLDTRSDLYLSMLETNYRDSGNIDLALKTNDQRMALLTPEDQGYAVVAFHRSLDYQQQGDPFLRKKFLIRSAISDTRSAIKDNASITLLANILFEEGDLKRAYNYIRYAMEDANFYNAKLRNVQISEIQPIIDRTYNLRNERQKQQLRLFLGISVLLFLFSMLTLWIIYKQKRKLQKAHAKVQGYNDQLEQLNQDLKDVNHRLKHLNSSLAEANHVKEEYIGLFLSICSTYIDKMEDMRKMVNREITKGRVAELLSYTKSGSFIDNELKEFYNNFDNTFLHIYPNFVKEFNNLLQPQERIELKPGEMLNTELRIFALIRLGIPDSSKIAGLLRYSVNTIYNYRAKIKNKSMVQRDDFEKLIMEINAPNVEETKDSL
ncbi:DUF6377 domain-containing protein [Geofilum rubicundum]|uniref:Regulatory protein SusR n=1 Tax=Geofilum rubicundum JCM 15548 TaxID=1236989 RepID=A0A0E9LXU7_9BACT|nr:DUF6377 domain-containing protein [Geofilum rubicundum]GAO29700.1 regulatory protein SusR [Geofilum rubicundum JCM 15548]